MEEPVRIRDILSSAQTEATGCPVNAKKLKARLVLISHNRYSNPLFDNSIKIHYKENIPWIQ
jgi:hypothetical protein